MLLLFKLNQDVQIKKLYCESDCNLTEAEFINLCNEVHSVPYNFLLMDFAPKEEHMKFRNGFDQFIIPKKINELDNNESRETVK